MTGKADFTADEWNLVREGPPLLTDDHAPVEELAAPLFR